MKKHITIDWKIQSEVCRMIRKLSNRIEGREPLSIDFGHH